MSVTLANLRTLQTNFMSMDLDNYVGESPSSAEQTTQLNWAQRTIARRLFMVDAKVTFTPVFGDGLIQNIRTACSKRVIQPFSVTINGNPLWNCAGNEIGLWSLAELFRYNPKWQTASAGTPTAAVYKGNGELILYLPPTSTVISDGNNFICGQVLPAEMSTDGSAPSIPEECHECLAYLAAVYAAMPMATEAEMWKRIEAFNGSWVRIVDEIAKENRDALQAWGSTTGYAVNDWMCG